MERLGSGQWNYWEGNSREWTVAFEEGALESKKSEVKLFWGLCFVVK